MPSPIKIGLKSSLYKIRFLGSIEAGWPSPAEEELIDTISLDEFLIRNKEATFMFKFKGDSMIDCGILPGDIVLIERGCDARDGDIIVAELGNQWLLRIFRKIGAKIYLESGNQKYPTINPKSTLKISAVVKAVIRKYK